MIEGSSGRLLICVRERGSGSPGEETSGERVMIDVEGRLYTRGGKPLAGAGIRMACLTSGSEGPVFESVIHGYTDGEGKFSGTLSASRGRALEGKICLQACADALHEELFVDAGWFDDEVAFFPRGQTIPSSHLLRGIALELGDSRNIVLDDLSQVAGSWSSRATFIRRLNRYTATRCTMSRGEVRQLIRRVKSDRGGLNDDMRPELVEALIEVESRRNPLAIGVNGELGLGQLHRHIVCGSAVEACETVPVLDLIDDVICGELTAVELFECLVNDMRADPYANISAVFDYLTELSNSFNGDELKTIAAYNCGFSRVNQATGRSGNLMANRLPRSTRLDYIPKVLGAVGVRPGLH
jgi:hypothetical protein